LRTTAPGLVSPSIPDLLHRYLDHNATSPLLKESLAASVAAVGQTPGNPSSIHWAGRASRRLIDDARDHLARFVGVEAASVVFTSGGTEANNLAIQGWLAGKPCGRIVVSAIEHPSVLRPALRLAESGWEVVLIKPSKCGVIHADAVAKALTPDTRLVCLMAANNETGAIQPVAAIGALCREQSIPLLVDAVQALGKIPLNLTDLGADFVSLSAHKIGGPKGVGALIIDPGRRLQELAPGGGQERGRRSGTENIAGIIGFSAALGVIDFSGMKVIRDAFEQHLHERMPDVTVFSEGVERLVNTSMFSVPGLDGETLLMQLDLAGFALASGSACSSGKRDSSHVLLAMGLSPEVAGGSIRVSLGPENTLDDVVALVDELCAIRQRLKTMAGIG